LPDRLKRAAQEEITKRLLAQEKAQKSNDAEYKNLEEAHPIATAVGEAVPVAAAPVLRLASGAGAGAAALNVAASSALPAALEYGTAQERGKAGLTAGASGAIGSGLASMVGKVAQGVSNTPHARGAAPCGLAEAKFNIPLDAAATTGNKALQTMNAAFENMPVTSGAEAVKKGARSDAFTREVMKTMGVAAEEASPSHVRRRQEGHQRDFERIFGKVHINLDDTGVQAKLAKVVQDAVDTLPDRHGFAIVVKRASQF
jgi:hypothetical protein